MRRNRPNSAFPSCSTKWLKGIGDKQSSNPWRRLKHVQGGVGELMDIVSMKKKGVKPSGPVYYKLSKCWMHQVSVFSKNQRLLSYQTPIDRIDSISRLLLIILQFAHDFRLRIPSMHCRITPSFLPKSWGFENEPAVPNRTWWWMVEKKGTFILQVSLGSLFQRPDL